MEQRNGRIDRSGQRDAILIHRFVGAGFRQNAKDAIEREPVELEGDLEFLL